MIRLAVPGLATLALVGCAALFPAPESNPELGGFRIGMEGQRMTFKSFYPGDTLKSEMTLDSGELTGPMLRYYRNGQVMEASRYVRGRLTGAKDLYFRDGKPMEHSEFVDDTDYVPFKRFYDSTGKVISTFEPDGDSLSGTYKVHLWGFVSHSIRYRKGIKDGLSVHIDSQGDTLSKVHYKDGTVARSPTDWKPPYPKALSEDEIDRTMAPKIREIWRLADVNLGHRKKGTRLALTLLVSPEGRVTSIHPSFDSTRSPEFLLAVVNLLKGAEFRKVKSDFSQPIYLPLELGY